MEIKTNESTPMEPEAKLRAVRHGAGATVRQIAKLLGLAGAHGNDRILEMEDGRRPVSGPIERVLDYIAQGVDTDSGELPNAILARYVPEFVQLRAPAGLPGADERFEGLLHTRYPRFVAVFSERLPRPMRERLANSGLEQLEMPEESGLGTMVAVPLDRPLHSLRPIMVRAAALVESRRPRM